MNRKILSLALALVMVLGTFTAVFAETTPLTTNDSKIQWLVDNEVVVGRKVNADKENKELALDSKITRAEVSKLLVYTLGKEKLADVLKGAVKVFPDVDLNHWANGYVSVLATRRDEDAAAKRRVIIGYEDGQFRPENDVTYAELATMLVRIVKKDLTAAMEQNSIWATSYIRWAEELGILEGITLTDSDAPATRRDAFVMIYNAMFKLGLLKGNKVDYGIKIGIVSKLQAGKIELNQDKAQTYNLTYNTVVTNGTTWNEVSVNTAVPGSLVRLIADENGNVTHLLVVSVPEFNGLTYTKYHRVDKDRIFDLGDGVEGKIKGEITFTENYKPAADFVVTEVVNGVRTPGLSISAGDDTRVFVADPANNAFREFKSLSEALRAWTHDIKTLKGFVIYNEFENYAGAKDREATYIVFTESDKFHGEKAVLRVRHTPNSLYNVELENTKGEAVIKNLKELGFLPGSYGLEQMDVVGLRLPTGNGATLSKVLIDYSQDNVYLVQKVADRYIVLRDKYGYEARIGMPTSTNVFLAGQLKKGAHVQISNEAVASNVKVISVVDLDLRGALDPKLNLKDTTVETGYVSSVEAYNSTVTGYSLVNLYDMLPNGQIVNRRTVLVSNDIATELIPGHKYEYRLRGGWHYEHGLPVAVEFKDLTVIPELDFVNAVNKLLPSTYANVTCENYDYRAGNAKMLNAKYVALEEARKLEKEVMTAKALLDIEINLLNDFAAKNTCAGTPVKKIPVPGVHNPNPVTKATVTVAPNDLGVTVSNDRAVEGEIVIVKLPADVKIVSVVDENNNSLVVTSNSFKMPNGKVTVNVMKEEKVTVTFDAKDATNKDEFKPVEVVKGQPVEKPATDPTPAAGKTFQHWSLTADGDAYEFSTPVNENITLHAVYANN